MILGTMFYLLSSVALIYFHLETLFALPSVTVIWWTNGLYPHFDAITKTDCPSVNCDSTHKVIPSNNSSLAFIFYGTDFNPEDLPFPRQSHIWALLHEESPMNNYIFSHSTGIKLFNYTSTFSRHSDYPLTTQFLPSIEYFTEFKPVSIAEKNRLRRQGFAPILYVQSHCNVASDRDRYVKTLMNFINIDSYGQCLHNKDLPNPLNSTSMYDSKEFLDFIARYKFHIAFENAICDDYITEKLFRPLHVGSVPIYSGSATAKDWEPSENSIIFASDFKSPEDLALFVKELDENDSLYARYLSFKSGVTNNLLRKTITERNWGVNDFEKLDFIKGFECFVCEKAMETNDSVSKIAKKLDMNCQQPRPYGSSELHLHDEWLREDWVESYWFGLDQARTIQKMIDAKENDSSTFFNYLMEMKYSH